MKRNCIALRESIGASSTSTFTPWVAYCWPPRQARRSVRVEFDEDVELTFADRCIYVQTKTRSQPLSRSDIASALSRFEIVSGEHEAGRRPGEAELWIISNSPPNDDLASYYASPEWPRGVQLRWPESGLPNPPSLPPAWPNLSEAAQWCSQRVASFPLRSVAAETLVLKLAALIERACTGADTERNHVFAVEELPNLLEQIVVQLQDFPDPPEHYFPHESEPALISDQRVRIVTGVSGAGKTAWASAAALSHSGRCAYFDGMDAPEATLAANLSRELAARFFSDSEEGLARVLLPGLGGLDALRAVNRELERRGIDLIVVLDNAHRLLPSALASAVGAMPTVRWALLAQPSTETRELEAQLGAKAEPLRGWSIDTLAQYLHERGCAADIETVERLRRLTGGYPLYVRAMADLACHDYGASITLLCEDLEALTHEEATPQERVLSRVSRVLPEGAAALMAILSLSDVPLTRDEIQAVAAVSLSASEQRTASVLRELSERGVVQRLGGSTFLHDAFRLIASAHLAVMDSESVSAARLELVERLKHSIECDRQFDLGRRRLYLRLCRRGPDAGTPRPRLQQQRDDARTWVLFRGVGLHPASRGFGGGRPLRPILGARRIGLLEPRGGESRFLRRASRGDGSTLVELRGPVLGSRQPYGSSG